MMAMRALFAKVLAVEEEEEEEEEPPEMVLPCESRMRVRKERNQNRVEYRSIGMSNSV